MKLAQPIDALGANLKAGLAQELVSEQSATHADFAMDAPHGKVDAFRVQRVFPGKHVLIDAVDECTV